MKLMKNVSVHQASLSQQDDISSSLHLCDCSGVVAQLSTAAKEKYVSTKRARSTTTAAVGSTKKKFRNDVVRFSGMAWVNSAVNWPLKFDSVTKYHINSQGNSITDFDNFLSKTDNFQKKDCAFIR